MSCTRYKIQRQFERRVVHPLQALLDFLYTGVTLPTLLRHFSSQFVYQPIQRVLLVRAVSTLATISLWYCDTMLEIRRYNIARIRLCLDSIAVGLNRNHPTNRYKYFVRLYIPKRIGKIIVNNMRLETVACRCHRATVSGQSFIY